MHFALYLPVAQIAVNPLAMIGLGGLVGFLSGLFGVGGGFLMTPLLMMMGIPATVAAASDSNQIVAATASGAYAHAKAGTVDVRMGSLLLVGGIFGGLAGVVLIKLLRSFGQADFVITTTYVVILGGIGSYMLWESLQGLRGTRRAVTQPARPSTWARLLTLLPWQMYFPRFRVRFSALVPLFFGALVGTLAAIMGVGGGFIMVPVMVYLLRMPIHVAVGTDLFQILITSIVVTVMQATANHTVDFILALLLLVGSVVGAQIGARVNRRLRADQLMILMSIIVLAVMVKMLVSLVVPPEVLLAYEGGH